MKAREREREREREKSLPLNLFEFFIPLGSKPHSKIHMHMHTQTLSGKTTWLPAASPPASSAARDLARLIIFLLIECRGTLQGWVIKLMQRMFVRAQQQPDSLFGSPGLALLSRESSYTEMTSS